MRSQLRVQAYTSNFILLLVFFSIGLFIASFIIRKVQRKYPSFLALMTGEKYFLFYTTSLAVCHFVICFLFKDLEYTRYFYEIFYSWQNKLVTFLSFMVALSGWWIFSNKIKIRNIIVIGMAFILPSIYFNIKYIFSQLGSNRIEAHEHIAKDWRNKRVAMYVSPIYNGVIPVLHLYDPRFYPKGGQEKIRREIHRLFLEKKIDALFCLDSLAPNNIRGDDYMMNLFGLTLKLAKRYPFYPDKGLSYSIYTVHDRPLKGEFIGGFNCKFYYVADAYKKPTPSSR